MVDISANIFFCEKVKVESDSLGVSGIFSFTSASNHSEKMRSIPFEVLISAMIIGEVESPQKERSLYYILEARKKKSREYKMLKEVGIGTFDESKYDGVFQSNSVFVFPDRSLIAEPGDYFVKVYYADSNKSTEELVGESEKRLINSQVLIVEE